MPSGSKRRKAAAAKKKKQETPTGPTPSGSEATAFSGGDDVKGQESDGGEVSSPASQDLILSGGHSFNEEGVVDKESLPVRQVDSEKIDVEEEMLDEGRIESTRELKSDEVLRSRGDLSVEVGKNSDSSSSSSDSDEKEVRIEKAEVVLNSAEVEEVYEAVECAEDSQVPAFVLQEVLVNADDSQSQVPAVVLEEVVEIADDSQLPAVVLEEVVKNADDSQMPVVVLDEAVSVSEASHVEELRQDLDNPVISELKATRDDALPAISPTVVSQGESSNVDSFHVKDAEDIALPPSDPPAAVIRNGTGYHHKDPEIQDSPEHQTPVLPAQLSLQRTSWKGCCGLFEVFTGSR